MDFIISVALSIPFIIGGGIMFVKAKESLDNSSVEELKEDRKKFIKHAVLCFVMGIGIFVFLSLTKDWFFNTTHGASEQELIIASGFARLMTTIKYLSVAISSLLFCLHLILVLMTTQVIQAKSKKLTVN